MLSYLHGFHAGNAADVLKHSVLVFCLTYLKKKEKPILCVDTHAGAGFYDLSGTVNREWGMGIGRLLQSAGLSDIPAASYPAASAGGEPVWELPPMIADYVKLCAGSRRTYLGSPAIMARILQGVDPRAASPQKGDRLVCFELHPREFESLRISMAELRGAGKRGPLIELRREDGPAGLKSLLPPPSRRALVFIDPSWEERDEYENIPMAVEEGLRRFPEGTFIIWYPLLAQGKESSAVSAPIGDVLFGLSEGKRCRIELRIRAPGAPESSPRDMYGSGLVIFNPPWTLRTALEETLPGLAKILGDGNGSWRLEWRE